MPSFAKLITWNFVEAAKLGAVELVADALKKLGIRVILEKAPTNIQGVYNEIGQLATATNHRTKAKKLVQKMQDQIAKTLSTNALGVTVDYSDVIIAAGRISGVDSINISKFNVSGAVGRKSFIKALDNQTINPGNIFIEAVSRKDFRIT